MKIRIECLNCGFEKEVYITIMQDPSDTIKPINGFNCSNCFHANVVENNPDNSYTVIRTIAKPDQPRNNNQR